VLRSLGTVNRSFLGACLQPDTIRSNILQPSSGHWTSARAAHRTLPHVWFLQQKCGGAVCVCRQIVLSQERRLATFACSEFVHCREPTCCRRRLSVFRCDRR